MNKFTLTAISLSLIASHSIATELVYTPINPSFGGNPLNGSLLMGKAQAQNKHKDHIEERSYAEKFQESLERAYINKMVREITDLAFGEDVDDSVFNKDSVFVSGDYEIQILTSNSDSITVQITHLLNGEITVIEVPKFG
ncbi:curli assembly protein CsgF [Bowmanella yangjiangensis]|uniref:Curli production assembly/transport component CsgF n=1 Tax=Bowmanella yangjiangensis TaxID=2811230 RepID=A0ABS3CNF3_9ALTE|nr:curli assembly protein CsgF [Bowmanella yangjiangensis]MBN7818637.1 curli production assembly protein CsgF [Bowmanella yangjiangensis]